MKNAELQKKLLSDRRVIDEINRHRWIESERVGQDIGFEQASADWIERFSKAWMDYHMPKRKPFGRRFFANTNSTKEE